MWNERSAAQQFLIKIVSNYLVKIKTNRGVNRARNSDYNISWAGRSVLLSELMILLTSYPARQIDVVEKIKLKRSELSRGESYILLEMYVFSLQNLVQTRALFFHTTCMIIDEPTT